MATSVRRNNGDKSATVPTGSGDGRHKLEFHRVFMAPREVVFRAWTEPEHVRLWWDPTGAPLQTCEIDLRNGGAFRWVDQAGHQFAGTYRSIVRPERIVIGVRTWPERPELIGTQTFKEGKDGTELAMTIECASQADLEALREMRVDVGTARTLQNFAEYLPALLRSS